MALEVKSSRSTSYLGNKFCLEERVWLGCLCYDDEMLSSYIDQNQPRIPKISVESHQ